MKTLKLVSKNMLQDNISKIQNIFPACVVEAFDENGVVSKKIDFDALQQELSDSIVEGFQERYLLNWPGKKGALLLANTPTVKTLRPYVAESVNFDKTKNILIEGDNLEALKLLQESYLGKIKVIYIDPPYNTGKDFLYSDNFAESASEYLVKSSQVDEIGNRLSPNQDSNGRFHSNWLSMLYPRLRLSRNLMSDDGVIFVSIDENEASNLKKLLDEIFGELNFIANIANINNPKGRSDGKFIAAAHEYIFVYAKDVTKLSFGGFELDETILKRYNKRDGVGVYREIDLRKTGDTDNRSDRPNMYFPFFFNPESSELRVGDLNETVPDYFIEILPMKSAVDEGCWRWGKDTSKLNLKSLIAKFMPSKKQWSIFEKDYLEGRSLTKSTTVWNFKDVNSERGSEQFIELGFKKEIFPRPKPIGTIERILKLATSNSEPQYILDFFAGSGTTAQAIFEANQKDSGDRRFILVQIPEECDEKSVARSEGFTCISDITKERIRRAGNLIIKNSNTETIDIGFRVLKVDISAFSNSMMRPDLIQQDLLSGQIDNIAVNRSAEDLLFEVLLSWGVEPSLPIEKKIMFEKEIFIVDSNALAACFDNTGSVDDELVQELACLKPLRAVFRDGGFKNDAIKINVEQIFKAISPNTEVRSI